MTKRHSGPFLVNGTIVKGREKTDVVLFGSFCNDDGVITWEKHEAHVDFVREEEGTFVFYLDDQQCTKLGVDKEGCLLYDGASVKQVPLQQVKDTFNI